MAAETRRPAPADHPIHPLLGERWSPRAFSERPVPRAELLRLFEAARWAPSCFNDQPWHFVVGVKQDDPGTWEKVLDCLVEKNRSWARAAPVLALSVARTTFERTGKPNRHAWHDVGLAVENLVIQATASGLWVHQMAGFLPEKAREAFAIPEGHEPVAAVALGHQGDADALPEALREREAAPRVRKPLAGFVFSGTWGHPAGFLSP